MKRKILSFILIGIIVIGLTGCGDGNSSNSGSPFNKESTNNNSNSNSNSNSNGNVKSKSKNPGLGDTFEFDGLEFTFDSTYSFVTLENRYSERNGATVIKLGVTVKNISEEKNKLNMFYYDLFGSKGVELDSVSAYFRDDVIDFAGDLKPGASYEAYFYILYDGDGEYSIDFDNFREEVSVEFNISK